MSLSTKYRQGQSARKAVGGYRLGGETPTKLRLPLASINNVRHERAVSGTAVTPIFSENAWKPRPELKSSWLDEPLVKTVRKPSLPPLKLAARKCAPIHIDAENSTPIRAGESNISTRKHNASESLQNRARVQLATMEEQERRWEEYLLHQPNTAPATALAHAKPAELKVEGGPPNTKRIFT